MTEFPSSRRDENSDGTQKLVSKLQYTIAGGMFLLDSFDPDIAAQDNFAPQQIRDLDLLQAIYGEDYITLGWTAPGDDLDWGTGK